jgi:hypothetical protein
MKSRHYASCVRCGGIVRPGDEFAWENRVGSWHVKCPDDQARFAWAAGLFDGEGHSHMTGGKTAKYRYPALRINQTSDDGPPEVLERMADLFSGNVTGPYTSDVRRPVYTWAVSGRAATAAMRAMWPHLSRSKREQMIGVLQQVAESDRM